jgi:tetratricopeptide (TPR) repeat protein
MLDAFKALGWLNAIDHGSHLNNEARRLIRAAAGFSPQDTRVKLILERLRSLAHSLGDPLETAEILLCCAAIGKWRGWCPQAARDATEAVLCYDDDDHRRAVALWMQGIIQWEMHQNHDAYRNCTGAKELFRKRQLLFQHFPEEDAWYKNQIRQMEVYLVTRPEEVWTWLNYFEPSSLKPPTKQVVECVQDRIRGQTYQNVYALMQDLQEANRQCAGVYERAEIYLEFGLAVYQLGNTHYAIELLRKAVQYFYPGIGSYHKQVIARCMLGAVEWMQPFTHKQAAVDWKRCIAEFEDLRRWADRDNLQKKEEWYAQHCEILRAALLERRQENPHPVDPDTEFPEESGPIPPLSTPNPQNPNLYQDLLAICRGDAEMAERLIEFERKKVPGAERNEWIKRAIERWIRDNQ